MAIMMGSLYEALVESGTSATAAKKAANHQKQLADMRFSLAMVMALLGVAVTGIVALVIRTFFT